MNSVLFCIPLKDDSVEKYTTIINDMAKDAEGYRDMLKRYDLYSSKVWVNTFGGKDYAMVYHQVGPNFAEKLATWETSVHPYDQQLNEKFKLYMIKVPQMAEVLLSC